MSDDDRGDLIRELATRLEVPADLLDEVEPGSNHYGWHQVRQTAQLEAAAGRVIHEVIPASAFTTPGHPAPLTLGFGGPVVGEATVHPDGTVTGTFTGEVPDVVSAGLLGTRGAWAWPASPRSQGELP